MAEYESPRGLLGMMFPQMGAEARDNIRSGLAGLGALSTRGRPNLAVQQAVADRRSDYSDRRREAGQLQRQEAERNRTAQVVTSALQQMGAPDWAIQLAQADPRAGLQLLQEMRQGTEPTKGVEINNRLVNPITGELIADFSDGTNEPAAIQSLRIRAQEAGLQPGTPEYQRFMMEGGRAAGMSLSVGADGSIRFTQGDVKDPTDVTSPSSPAAMISSIEGILNDPALDFATGWLEWTQNIPGTGSRRFGARANQLEGQAFLQAFESLKGGGHITEIEGQKATQAIGRLDTAQRAEDYRKALEELRDTLQLGIDRQMKGIVVQNPWGGGAAGGSNSGGPAPAFRNFDDMLKQYGLD